MLTNAMPRYEPLSTEALELIHSGWERLGREVGVPMRLVNLAHQELTEALNRGWGHRDSRVGSVTSAVWSPRLGTNVAIGMLEEPHTAVGSQVEVHCPDGARAATVSEMPFPGASQR